jgi:hypothetical protein
VVGTEVAQDDNGSYMLNVCSGGLVRKKSCVNKNSEVAASSRCFITERNSASYGYLPGACRLRTNRRRKRRRMTRSGTIMIYTTMTKGIIPL